MPIFNVWGNPCIYNDVDGLIYHLVAAAIVGIAINVGARVLSDCVREKRHLRSY